MGLCGLVATGWNDDGARRPRRTLATPRRCNRCKAVARRSCLFVCVEEVGILKTAGTLRTIARRSLNLTAAVAIERARTRTACCSDERAIMMTTTYAAVSTPQFFYKISLRSGTPFFRHRDTALIYIRRLLCQNEKLASRATLIAWGRGAVYMPHLITLVKMTINE